MAATGLPVLLFAAFTTFSTRGVSFPVVLKLWEAYFGTAFAVWAIIGVVAILLVFARPLATRDFRLSPRELVTSILTSRWREDFGLSVIWPPLVMSVLFGAYVLFKQTILRSAGFGADAVLDHLDRLIFLGFRPWQLTHALPAPWTTLFLDRLYASWFLPMTATFLTCAFVSDRGHLRTQYVLAFVWTWLFGAALLGYLLGSAGPCYGGSLPGDATEYQRSDRGAAVRRRRLKRACSVHGAHLVAVLRRSDTLETFTCIGSLGFGGCISAMPSMHVAQANPVRRCGFRRIGRVLGWVALAYAVLVFVGIHTPGMALRLRRSDSDRGDIFCLGHVRIGRQADHATSCTQ